jgi:hypothetical protein
MENGWNEKKTFVSIQGKFLKNILAKKEEGMNEWRDCCFLCANEYSFFKLKGKS